ncbi:translation initiation factor IF-2-like [Corvus kubaryi]|uniref:translation initiation factor IF-2-like n=1 Tax=Corvus kubaryi TaxID=68294 RepID=UPI001C05E9DE|nr:translation initiation factor IF-2-like [Corvus kubaryi]
MENLAPQSAQLGSEQALLVQPGALQERLCPDKRSRPPKSSRGTLRENPTLRPRPIPATAPASRRVPRASPPGEHHSASRSPYPAACIRRIARPCTALRAASREPRPRPPHSTAQRTARTLHSTPRTRHRTAHSTAPGTPRTSHSAPRTAPRTGLRTARRSLPLRPSPPASGAHRRERTAGHAPAFRAAPPCFPGLSRARHLSRPEEGLPQPGRPRPAEGPGERPWAGRAGSPRATPRPSPITAALLP